MKITVDFDGPNDGWIGITLTDSDQRFYESVSYTPYDSFVEVASALRETAQLEADLRQAAGHLCSLSGQPLHQFANPL
jgi:hypothetical protein